MARKSSAQREKAAMSRKPRVPSYRLHKQSGQAVVTLTDALTGRRKDFLLGPFDSRESKDEYTRIVLDWQARGGHLPQSSAEGSAPDLTVAELVARYWRHVEEYYRHADGTPTGEVQAMRYGLRPLNHLYGRHRLWPIGPQGRARADGPGVRAPQVRAAETALPHASQRPDQARPPDV
jgi:hypothetical protein